MTNMLVIARITWLGIVARRCTVYCFGLSRVITKRLHKCSTLTSQLPSKLSFTSVVWWTITCCSKSV